ncbi:glycosyltransferase family 4 protein [Algoriphagus halophytocola]|uniref:Glycosyltransferase family 4 protein n=1 Tax=Algoriphagus halophytocola TaxID=2991499 RepID=A0ABY6MJS5_9BACT|nr:glycosyltransferase family 4 protein [Algoriphagus sp. TR-M5]UZD23898.1 glycosyltransferase family 4 protein [Algoriphagus sp. TR-M5]
MHKTKILFCPKYPKIGASSRLRTYQFLPLWEKEGLEIKVSSFFNEKYLTRFYTERKHSPLNVLGCYFRRFWVLLGAWKYDVIWIEKELFPFLPSYAEWILEKMGRGYVVDYDDAVFHNYDSHPNALVRNWMGDKIAWVMRHSRLVCVGNAYLKEYAFKAGAMKVEILPTVVDLKKYPLKRKFENSLIRIGWVGSPTTMKYLNSLKVVFRKLGESYNLELLVINAKGIEVPDMGISSSLIPWSEEKEGELISSFDIGIMPLPDDDWERGKCAYKLIQYMACGLPVVASPVGMNKEVVREGWNGFLANDVQDWENSLVSLIKDVELRKTMGQNGRQLVEEKYTVQRNFKLMRSLFEDHLY